MRSWKIWRYEYTRPALSVEQDSVNVDVLRMSESVFCVKRKRLGIVVRMETVPFEILGIVPICPEEISFVYDRSTKIWVVEAAHRKVSSRVQRWDVQVANAFRSDVNPVSNREEFYWTREVWAKLAIVMEHVQQIRARGICTSIHLSAMLVRTVLDTRVQDRTSFAMNVMRRNGLRFANVD